MSILDRRNFLLSGLALGANAAWAGQEPPRPKREESLLGQLVPKPTGQNGYEELLAAADALRKSRVFAQAEVAVPDPPLAWKREVLLDPPVVRCLGLLQRGVAKPIHSPRQEVDLYTVLPEMAPFRS